MNEEPKNEENKFIKFISILVTGILLLIFLRIFWFIFVILFIILVMLGLTIRIYNAK